MRERPIIFSAPLVRAILDGRKSQTRRIAKPQPHKEPRFIDDGFAITKGGTTSSIHTPLVAALCPYGQPGDRLWVRETWMPYATGHQGTCVMYRADGATVKPSSWTNEQGAWCESQEESGRWRASIHMPRWASRITLEITGVRVERLQDISEADAQAEGIKRSDRIPSLWNSDYPDKGCGTTGDDREPGPVCAYRSLWNRIHGYGSWAANPWVWVVQFNRQEPHQ